MSKTSTSGLYVDLAGATKENLEHAQQAITDELARREPRYRIGQRFRCCESFSPYSEYLLAQPLHGQVALVSLKDGNRWISPVKVRNVTEITPDELRAVMGLSKFILIEE